MKLCTVPTGAVVFVTPIGPLTKSGTTALSSVEETCITDDAGVPLNFTFEVEVKPIPLMVAVAPTGPLSGSNPVTDSVGVKTPRGARERCGVQCLGGRIADERRRLGERPADRGTDADSSEPAFGAEEIMRAIAQAPAAQRDAVIAVDVLGMSYAEAARACGHVTTP